MSESQSVTQAASRNRRQLKNLLINPRYQLKYIFWLTLTGLLLTLINCVIFYRYISENYGILVELVPMTEDVKRQLYGELHQIIVILAIVSVVFVSLVSLIGLYLSHRTAGPMFHFKRVFAAIKDGKTQTRVNLRPSDDFRDVAQAFNDMMDSVTGKKH